MDLAEKNAMFGDNLPNFNHWESYIKDPKVLNEFEKNLTSLEQADAEAFKNLQDNPGLYFSLKFHSFFYPDSGFIIDKIFALPHCC